MREVRFTIEGVELAADLYFPPNVALGERRPALVAGHGFGFVKEGLVSQGEYFSAAGYVVLAIDYRSFGRSGGTVRGELFPERMIEDFRGGISYLETIPEVDAARIGLWGTSFGGALVLATAARDRRVAATVAQVPIVDGQQWMQWLRTPDQWQRVLAALELDRRNRFAGAPSARIPIARHFGSDEISGMPTDHAVLAFMAVLDTQVKTWAPDIALESVGKIAEFRPSATIGQIAPRPLCIIANTGYEVLHPLEPVLNAFAAAREPKRLELLPYDQLGLYSEPGASHGLRVALDFLHAHLPL